MLHDTQQKFLDGLFSEETPDILDVISTDGNFSPKQRFQVYQNNVKFILTDLLKTLYPVISQLVGIDFFNYVAFSYIVAKPPTSGDMTFYGETFPEFIQSFIALKDHPYLSDTARLEWAWYASGMAGNRKPLTPKQLSNINEDNIPDLTFSFQPHVLLLQSTYAINQLWQTITEGQIEHLSDIQLEQETSLMLYRSPDQNITFLSLDPAAYHFTMALKNGQDFGTAVNEAFNIDNTFTPEPHLSYFLSNQILISDE